MANCVFGWPIYSDASALYTPTLSGVNWQVLRPLTHVQDRRLSKIARSSDIFARGTFEVDLQIARPIRVIAVLLPNLTATGTVQVKGSNTNSDWLAPIYDSGAITPYPAGHTAETLGALIPTLVVVPDAPVELRYWQVTITDLSNPDGHVDVARLILAGGWQPSINMSRGARLGLETETERTLTDGGSAVYNDRPRRRTLDFDLALLPEDEALERGFDLQRLAGTSQQMFFVFDPADTTHMHRRSFLCVLRNLTAVEYPYHTKNSIPLQLVEEI